MAEEAENTSIKQLIQRMIGNGVEILQGIVKSDSPLKIQVVNDEKLIIGLNITHVPRHLTDYTTTCSFAQEGKRSIYETEDSGSQRMDTVFSGYITVHNALKTGEKVHILSFNHGKQYYVLDRVV